jgi:hypothetical protein
MKQSPSTTLKTWTVRLLTARVEARDCGGGVTTPESQWPGDIIEVDAATGARMVESGQAERCFRVRRLFEVMGDNEARRMEKAGAVEILEQM